MTRNHRTARDAGTRFERQIADTLAHHINPDIDRRARTGKDKGDITGLHHMGARIVVEVKNTSRTQLGAWLLEVDVERRNDDAAVGIVIAKRHGHGDPLDSVAIMTVRDLIALITGERPGEET